MSPWRGLLVALLVAPGCQRVFEPSCQSDTRDLADDEALPDLDVSVAELYAAIAGERVVPAQVLGPGAAADEVATVGVSVTRGEGRATWTESSVVEEQVGTRFGIGSLDEGILVICHAGLDAPASVAVDRADGSAELQAEGTLSAVADDLEDDVTVSVRADTVDGTGGWSDVNAAFVGFGEGALTGVQLQANDDIVLDWR